MALPPLIAVDALSGWLGQSLSDTDPRVVAVLSASSSMVRSYTGRTWMVDGALVTVPDDVQTVVVQLAARAWNNPDGYATERLGDYSYGLPAAAVTGLSLTAAERAVLDRHRARGYGLWTLSTTREDPAADTEYVPVVGGQPFPWSSDGWPW